MEAEREEEGERRGEGIRSIDDNFDFPPPLSPSLFHHHLHPPSHHIILILTLILTLILIINNVSNITFPSNRLISL